MTTYLKTFALSSLLFVLGYFLTCTFCYHSPKEDLYVTPTPEIVSKEEKPFVILTFSYNNSDYVEKNLSSIFSQDYKNYRVIYIDDASTDDTFAKAKKLTSLYGMQERTLLIRNETNQGAMANHYHAIKLCKDEEIVAIVDGDDWLTEPGVLKKLNNYYSDPSVWAASSLHVEYPDYRQAVCSKPHPMRVVKEGTYRQSKWSTSHLRSFYAWLAKLIPLDACLKEGQFFSTTYDIATTMPMLEMAREHFIHIPENFYAYNLGNPISDMKIHTVKQRSLDQHIRALPSFPPLKEPPPKTSSMTADVVLFSFNRPMQLWSLLESIDHYMKGVEDIFVIYRANSDQFEEGYELVKERFPNVCYLRQPEDGHARESFKPLMLQSLFRPDHSKADYVIFGVDDLIVKDHVDLSYCIEQMEMASAYGFYLRLGEHVDYCYTENSPQKLPPLIPLGNVYAWQFSAGEHDWDYPHSVDMTLFKKETIKSSFWKLPFDNPSKLEAKWAQVAPHNKVGLCFKTSKVVNLPLNLVTDTYKNRHMNLYSPEELLTKFLDGQRIDISTLYQIQNKSAHIDYEPRFISLN